MATTVGGVEIDLGALDFLQKNIPEAHKKLNMQIVADMEPLIPFRQGALRGSVRFPLGIYGNVIEYDTPYARYQYGGIVYGPNIPIKDKAGNIIRWVSPKGQTKYPKVDGSGKFQHIVYHTPGTTDHWFEVAKAQHLNEWKDLVRRTLTGGA